MYARYSLFHSHIDLAHKHWRSLIMPGDLVVDATCGNGHDTLVLAELALAHRAGKLYALDVQPIAIETCKQMLSNRLPRELYEKIRFVQGCHSVFPEEIRPQTVRLVAYNLGYLPGGDKNKTTKSETTLKSIQESQTLLQNGGVVSITCYPGHPEGEEEEQKILDFASSLDPKQWSCCHHRWMNRKNSPTLLLIQKRVK